MSTPLFTQTAKERPFKPFPTEYTDRYTPEVARHEGFEYGVRTYRQSVIDRLRAIKNPTKQILTVIEELEAEEDE